MASCDADELRYVAIVDVYPTLPPREFTAARYARISNAVVTELMGRITGRVSWQKARFMVGKAEVQLRLRVLTQLME